MGDPNKLAQALQNAALENINEDIHTIHGLLEGIRKEAPQFQAELIEGLKKDVESLGLALKAVPDSFDVAFNSKMNSLLDAASEVTKHTLELERKIKGEISDSVEKQSEKLANEFNKKIKGYKVVRLWHLLIYCTLSATAGGAIAGFLVWNVFPEIF